MQNVYNRLRKLATSYPGIGKLLPTAFTEDQQRRDISSFSSRLVRSPGTSLYIRFSPRSLPASLDLFILYFGTTSNPQSRGKAGRSHPKCPILIDTALPSPPQLQSHGFALLRIGKRDLSNPNREIGASCLIYFNRNRAAPIHFNNRFFFITPKVQLSPRSPYIREEDRLSFVESNGELHDAIGLFLPAQVKMRLPSQLSFKVVIAIPVRFFWPWVFLSDAFIPIPKCCFRTKFHLGGNGKYHWEEQAGSASVSWSAV